MMTPEAAFMCRFAFQVLELNLQMINADTIRNRPQNL